ncbi:DUF4376 domain-containing protein [Mesorhizobium sp.]|uniref:DUF4376 domain-containing protein n=1 Tax=Mesorhizobium sp. TaxID=1871066 RepID=UPI00120BD5F2|nr:DUF4376 domain-containing protein [Mesorhizobium sp.]TIW97782.1 MAG: DUF4376 domain-containing protein [Mesorhizobium sp.]
MRFVKIDPADNTRAICGHPGWFTGDTPDEPRLLTEDELVALGFGLKVVDEAPDYDPVTQTRTVAPIDEWETSETTASVKYVVGERSLEDVRASTLAKLADRRWSAETGGIIFGGVPVKTDRESASKLTAAYIKADKDAGYSIPNWKVAEGVFVTLTAATIIATGDAVTAHVQACFDREAALTAEILAAETPADLAAIDLESGWPG